MKKWIFIAFFLGLISRTECQNLIQSKLLASSPPSPNVSAIEKFGNYSVNLYHGLPEINIPIYTIQINNITIPISLNYHASGIKVNDWGSNVGTGWVLNAGGYISKSNNGRPDEMNTFPNRNINAEQIDPVNNQNDYEFLQAIVTNGSPLDLEKDVYSYNLPFGASGKFIVKNYTNSECLFFPRVPYKFTRNLLNNQHSYEITTDDGIKYIFADLEITTSNNAGSMPNGTYHLSKVISADKVDTIFFEYSVRNGTKFYDLIDYIAIHDKVEIINDNCLEEKPYTEQILNNLIENPTFSGTELTINKIKFKGGEVEFNQSLDDRLDGFTGQKKMDNIKVFSYKNNQKLFIKRVDFVYDYFIKNNDLQTRRIKLNQIITKDNSGNELSSYSFGYNSSVVLPKRLSREIDYWGYYNNKPNNTLVPQMQVDYFQGINNPYASTITIGSNVPNSREVDVNYSQACMLNKIVYPTGGSTIFEFENNSYLEGSNAKYAGGHRIKRILNYDKDNSIASAKTYKYGLNESGFGRSNFYLDYYNFYNEKNYELWAHALSAIVEKYQTKRVRNFSSSPTFNLTPLDNSPVTYAEVIEYEEGISTNNGKTLYRYSDVADEVLQSTTYVGKNYLKSNHLLRGLLNEKIVYSSESGIYSPVKKDEYKYHATSYETYENFNLQVEKVKIFDKLAIFVTLGQLTRDCGIDYYNGNELPDFDYHHFNDKYSFGYYNQLINTIDLKLIEQKSTIYNNSNLLNETKQIEYNNNYLLPINTLTKNSKGENIKTTFTYPFDLPLNGANLNLLNNYQISSPSITTTINQTKNKILNVTKNEYQIWNTNYAKLSSVKQSFDNLNFNDEFQILNYNSFGLPTEYVTKEGINEVIIYGYNNLYPVAKIVGTTWATANAIFNTAELAEINNPTTDAALRTVLQKLRTNLPNTFVTSYTYSPLIGITSETDPNNKTKYYEYDSFNRLKLIKDFNGNILKTFDYKYKQTY
jgi:hypothetical protein